MKNVIFSAALICCLLTACADNAAVENDTTAPDEPIEKMSMDSTMVMNADSSNAAEEKRVKDSATAAHGHAH